jgi:hypothetical protein
MLLGLNTKARRLERAESGSSVGSHGDDAGELQSGGFPGKILEIAG